VTKWGLRSGRELAAVANVLGLDLGEAIDSASLIPQTIVNDNRKKLSDRKWDGVEIVD
jgi:RNase P/RNase MRP subunit p30